MLLSLTNNSPTLECLFLSYLSNVLLIAFRLINRMEWPLSACPRAPHYSAITQAMISYWPGSLPGSMKAAKSPCRVWIPAVKFRLQLSLNLAKPADSLPGLVQLVSATQWGTVCVKILKHPLSQWCGAWCWKFMSGDLLFNSFKLQSIFKNKDCN